MQLQIVQGSYHFELPTSFYPDYSRHGVDAGQFKYSFSYRVVLACQTNIYILSIPNGAEAEAKTDSMVEFHGSDRCRKFNFYWRTRDMMKPQLLLAKNHSTNEVACIASLAPTFEPPAP